MDREPGDRLSEGSAQKRGAWYRPEDRQCFHTGFASRAVEMRAVYTNSFAGGREGVRAAGS